MFHIDWKQGSQAVLAQLGADGAFIDDGYAKKHHLKVGSPVELTTPTGSSIRSVRGHLQAADRGSPFGAGDDLERDLGQRLYANPRTSTRS